MYVMLSVCPICGAPIFAHTGNGEVAILDANSGLWSALPEVAYTCACRAEPTPAAIAAADTAQRTRRRGSFGTGRSES